MIIRKKKVEKSIIVLCVLLVVTNYKNVMIIRMEKEGENISSTAT